jgi:hypothetical protein
MTKNNVLDAESNLEDREENMYETAQEKAFLPCPPNGEYPSPRRHATNRLV